MRIFPEGVEEWMVPLGTAFIILGFFAMVIGGFAWAFNAYHYKNWPHTPGSIATSEVLHTSNSEGQAECREKHVVDYVVGKFRYHMQVLGAPSSDCEGLAEGLAVLHGKTVDVIYDPASPRDGFDYNDKGTFFAGAWFALLFGAFFAGAGVVSRAIGKWFRAKRIQLP